MASSTGSQCSKSEEFTMRAMHIGIILCVAILVQTVSSHVIRANLEKQKHSEPGVTRRGHTLAMVADSAVMWLVIIITILLVAERMYVRPTTLLAVTGIGALIVGIGARTVIKDFFASLLIVAETQYYHGENVTIYGPVLNVPLEGTVENITLRVTELRRPDNSLVFIPNGNITAIVNTSRDKMRIKTDVEIPTALASEQALDALANYRDTARRELAPMGASEISALGVTRVYHDRIIYTYVVHAPSDRKSDIQAKLHRGLWRVLLRNGATAGRGARVSSSSR